MIAVPSGVRLPVRLVSAEVMKIRTTRAWWLFAGGFVVLSALTALFGWASAHNVLHPTLSDYPDSGKAAVLAQAERARTASGAAQLAASMLTSGQFLLVLVALMLGVHVATGELAARTMTSTFLVEPRRGRVIAAKLAVCGLFGVAFWAIATVLDGAVTPVFLATQHLLSSALGSPDAVRAVAMGLLAYVLWALFGLGLGAVLRSQVVAVVAAIAIYAGGLAVVELVVHLLYDAGHAPWLLSLAILAPAEASSVMITAGQAFPHAPPWWAGALVLAGYCAGLTIAGIAVMRRRDVS